MILNFKSIEPKTYEILNTKVKIRPFPNSEEDVKVDFVTGVVITKLGEIGWSRFNYCVMDIEGLVDVDKKPIECNEEVKRFIYDYDTEFKDSILLKIKEMNDGLLDEVKN